MTNVRWTESNVIVVQLQQGSWCYYVTVKMVYVILTCSTINDYVAKAHMTVGPSDKFFLQIIVQACSEVT